MRTSYSQDTPEQRLHQAIALYEEGVYEESITHLKELIALPIVPRTIRGEAYKYLGFNYWEQGEIEQAKREFKHALALDPQLQMGAKVSPLIVASFGEALSEFLKERRAQQRQALVVTTRRGAVLRSLVTPGWGQLYRGYQYKGLTIGGISAVTVFGLVLADQAFRDTKGKYDNGKIGENFDALHQEVKEKADRANLWAYGVAAVWVYNLIDTVISGPNLRRYEEAIGLDSSRQGIRIIIDNNSMKFGYRVSL